MVQKVFGIRQTYGTKASQLQKTGTKMTKGIQTLEEGRVPAKEAKNWRIDGEKAKNYEKGVSEAVKQF